MAHKISSDCVSCGSCAAECPAQAISQGDTTYVVNPDLCVDCGACESVCPMGAIQPE